MALHWRMTGYEIIWYYLWVAPHLLEIAIVWLMVSRKLYTQFFAFFSYVVFEIIQFIVLIAISSSNFKFGDVYYRVYLAGLAASTVLRFAIIYEVLAEILRRYKVLAFQGTQFRLLTAMVIFLAIVLVTVSPASPAGRIANLVQTGDRSASVLQCAMLLTLLLFSKLLDLHWRTLALSIGLGIGVIASSELLVAAIRAGFGKHGHPMLNLINMTMYHASVLIWLFYLLFPARRCATVYKVPDNDLESWNHELQQLLRQ